MKLFDILLGKKKAKPSKGNVPITPVRHPPEKKPSTDISSKTLPQKQPPQKNRKGNPYSEDSSVQMMHMILFVRIRCPAGNVV